MDKCSKDINEEEDYFHSKTKSKETNYHRGCIKFYNLGEKHMDPNNSKEEAPYYFKEDEVQQKYEEAGKKLICSSDKCKNPLIKTGESYYKCGLEQC